MTILHDNLYTTRAGTSASDLQYLTRPTQWKALVSRKTSTGQAGRIRTGMYQRDVGLLWPNPRPLPQEHVRRWHRVRWMISLRIDSETRRALQTHPMKNHQSLKGQPKKVHPRVHHWLPPRPLPQVRPRVHHWLPPRPLPQVRPRVHHRLPPRPLPQVRPRVHLRLPPRPLPQVRPRVHLRLPPRPLPQVRPRVHLRPPPRPLPQVRPRVHLRLPPRPLPQVRPPPLHRPRRWSKRERMHHRMQEKSHLQVRTSRQSPIMM